MEWLYVAVVPIYTLLTSIDTVRAYVFCNKKTFIKIATFFCTEEKTEKYTFTFAKISKILSKVVQINLFFITFVEHNQ